jgi:hypothetical protein
MARGGGIALHQHAVDLAASQVARKCHADWTAAHDEDRDLLHARNIDRQFDNVNCQPTSVPDDMSLQSLHVCYSAAVRA